MPRRICGRGDSVSWSPYKQSLFDYILMDVVIPIAMSVVITTFAIMFSYLAYLVLTGQVK